MSLRWFGSESIFFLPIAKTYSLGVFLKARAAESHEANLAIIEELQDEMHELNIKGETAGERFDTQIGLFLSPFLYI
jgi:hypothetical protein